MQVHPDVVAVLKKEILPHVIRIQNFDVPWPAELRSGNPWLSYKHEEGVVMFNIGRGDYLNAEYFCHDDSPPQITGTGKLTMADTRIEIPNRVLGLNPKTAEYFGNLTPDMTAYDLRVDGWIGGPVNTKTRSAQMTLLGLPELHLPQMERTVSNEDQLGPTFTRQEDTDGYAADMNPYPMHGVTWRNFKLEMGPGDWSIQLTGSNFSSAQETGRLYHATLTRMDCSTFALSDERIGDALYKFLSFQAGRWITTPTIVCEPGETGGHTAKFARIGRLTSERARPPDFLRSASQWQRWPILFGEFLNLYNDPASHEHLQNAVYHYVEANQVLEEASLGQALVAAQSTLQALTRWWNELDTNFRFGLRNGPTFEQLLIKAAQKAKLGSDAGAAIDEDALSATIKEAADYRNDIDHGRGGNIRMYRREVVDCQVHHQNLARLLILAKLGGRDTETRGYHAGPKFKT